MDEGQADTWVRSLRGQMENAEEMSYLQSEKETPDIGDMENEGCEEKSGDGDDGKAEEKETRPDQKSPET